jgi:hypothetical protein
MMRGASTITAPMVEPARRIDQRSAIQLVPNSQDDLAIEGGGLNQNLYQRGLLKARGVHR